MTNKTTDKRREYYLNEKRKQGGESLARTATLNYSLRLGRVPCDKTLAKYDFTRDEMRKILERQATRLGIRISYCDFTG